MQRNGRGKRGPGGVELVFGLANGGGKAAGGGNSLLHGANAAFGLANAGGGRMVSHGVLCSIKHASGLTNKCEGVTW